MRDEADDTAYLKKRAEKIAKSLKEGNEAITLDGTLENLHTRDRGRVIPTFTREDLSDAEIKRIVEEENNKHHENEKEAMQA